MHVLHVANKTRGNQQKVMLIADDHLTTDMKLSIYVQGSKQVVYQAAPCTVCTHPLYPPGPLNGWTLPPVPWYKCSTLFGLQDALIGVALLASPQESTTPKKHPQVPLHPHYPGSTGFRGPRMCLPSWLLISWASCKGCVRISGIVSGEILHLTAIFRSRTC